MAPAKVFSSFIQTRVDSWSYVLFAGRLAINISHEDAFPIIPGKLIYFPVLLVKQIRTYHNMLIYQMTKTVTLSRYGEKAILVKRAKTGAGVSNYDEMNYKEIIDMVPLTKSFCENMQMTWKSKLELAMVSCHLH